MNKLTLLAAQVDLLVGDIEGNTDRIIQIAEEAAQRKVDLLLFPELSITGYPPEDLLFRPMLYQRVSKALEKLCETIHDITVIVGYPAELEGKRYNKAAVIQNGKIIADYAKQTLPNYTVFDEKRYFTPGNKPTVITLKGVKIGLIICEDTWFPEPIAQSKKAGAELIVSINASPFALDKSHARRNMLKQRCLETNLPIVYLNSVGGQDELVFDGGSMVFDKNGQLIQQGNYYQEDLMEIQWDVKNHWELLTSNTPQSELLDEEKLYRVLVLGVRDYIQKNHFKGAIIGLSGGVDSALTLAIACDAIGSEHVQAVMMPSQYTSNMSQEDASEEANALGCHYSVIEIDPIFHTFSQALKEAFKNHPADTTEENLQARSRGTLLMALSNKKGMLVLTTGNKSEMAVGYATLYGDMAGGFSVLKDVYKTMVYRLCRYRNSVSPVIPERVLERAPTAELAEGQLDQHMLPPYSILDEILERFIAKEQDPLTISKAGFDLEVIKKIVRMINRNEYKRRQAPIGIRLTEKAFGKDWRYPITSGYFKKYNEI